MIDKKGFHWLQSQEKVMSDRSEKENTVAECNEKFSLTIYNELKRDRINMIASPYGLSSVMAMVSMGAGGNTLYHIQSAFKFPSPSSLQLGYQDTIALISSVRKQISRVYLGFEIFHLIFCSWCIWKDCENEFKNLWEIKRHLCRKTYENRVYRLLYSVKHFRTYKTERAWNTFWRKGDEKSFKTFINPFSSMLSQPNPTST